jgi:hypothetical protein
MGQQGTIVFAADVSSRRLDCLRIHARNLLERAARGLAFVRSVTRDIKPYMAASISAQVLRGNRHWGGYRRMIPSRGNLIFRLTLWGPGDDPIRSTIVGRAEFADGYRDFVIRVNGRVLGKSLPSDLGDFSL